MPYKKQLHQALGSAGITVNGNNPWDIQIRDERLYQRVLSEGSLGLGEAYMEGWWDCERIDQFLTLAIKAEISQHVQPSLRLCFHWLKAQLVNLQTKSRAFIVGKKHYDIGNDLFQKMLDKRMAYSCAYWKNAETLDQAQEAKLDLVCKKLYLKPGMKVLDIGCGWGSFAKYAAENYQAHVVGITISAKQLELAKQICHGLPVDLRLLDYRDINEDFDRIVSIGQMEHVGYKNYRSYMKIVRKNLKDDGLFLLHTIGNDVSVRSCDPWIEKYIFPNGLIPSVTQLSRAAEGHFSMEDWHNFGVYYDKTLMAWYDNFQQSWESLKSNYDEKFYRMWNFYLLSCAAAFRARSLHLWQIVYSKNGLPGGYQAIR